MAFDKLTVGGNLGSQQQNSFTPHSKHVEALIKTTLQVKQNACIVRQGDHINEKSRNIKEMQKQDGSSFSYRKKLSVETKGELQLAVLLTSNGRWNSTNFLSKLDFITFSQS